MKTRNLSILLASLFVIAGAVFAAGARAEGEIPAPPAIGATIEDFTLPDADNKERSLKSLAGKNGTVLLFIAVQCPVSNAYNERMEKLAQDYKAKGIAVIGINSNVAEDAAAVKTHASREQTQLPDPERSRQQDCRQTRRHRHARSLLPRREQQARLSRTHRQRSQRRASSKPAICAMRSMQRSPVRQLKRQKPRHLVAALNERKQCVFQKRLFQSRCASCC